MYPQLVCLAYARPLFMRAMFQCAVFGRNLHAGCMEHDDWLGQLSKSTHVAIASRAQHISAHMDLIQLTEVSTKSSPLERVVCFLDGDRLVDLLDLLDRNLGSYYCKLDGRNWKDNKRAEMMENGLVYLCLYSDKSLAAFASYMKVEEEGLDLLYLYEIQVDERFRATGLGTYLLNAFHRVADSLRLDGTGLTVFSDNQKALNWYLRMGYKVAPFSPQDRKLRRGNTIKPAYYILLRQHDHL